MLIDIVQVTTPDATCPDINTISILSILYTVGHIYHLLLIVPYITSIYANAVVLFHLRSNVLQFEVKADKVGDLERGKKEAMPACE